MRLSEVSGEVVVTGLSGRYPNSDSVEELWDGLLEGKVLYGKDTFPYPKVFTRTPKVRGYLKDLTKFDHKFFKYDEKEASTLDPQIRTLLEVVYEALWDAGVPAEEWRGTRTGFFLGSSFDDTGLAVRWDQKIDFTQYFSQRVSYFYDFRGPTMIVDTACASSLNALHQAFWSIKSGECDQAVVAGISIHMKPQVSICFSELEMLSKSGDSRCLDANADGYVRSEAVVAVVLQRQSQAKRICARLVSSVTTNDGYTKEGITFPSEAVQTKTVKETIEQAGLSGLDVDYVEAHITGTPTGDPIESSSILQAYRGESSQPIMIGCLKANIGHAEASAGLCALSKVLKIFETGLIPPNINMVTPNPRIDGLIDGRLKSASRVTKFDGEFVGINAFGFGGSNSHFIVQNPRVAKEMDSQITSNQESLTPRLLCFCNRTMEGIEETFKFLRQKNQNLTAEFIAFLNNLSKSSPTGGLNWRAFVLIQDMPDRSKSLLEASVNKVRKVKNFGIILGSFIKPLFDALKGCKYLLQSMESMKLFLDQKDLDGKLSGKNFSALETILQQVTIIDLLHHLNIYPNWVICQSTSKNVAKYACGKLSRSDLMTYLRRLFKEKSQLMNGEIRKGKTSEKQLQESCELEKGQQISGNQQIMRTLLAKLKSKQKSFSKSFHKILAHDYDYFMVSRNDSTNELEQLDLARTTVVYLASECKIISLKEDLDEVLVEAKSTTVSNTPAVLRSVNSLKSFLQMLGHLYISGINVELAKFYPKVTKPLSCECPHIGHLLKWKHQRCFENSLYSEFFRLSFQTAHRIDKLDPNFCDLVGYKINGSELFPSSGYLWIIWDHLVKMRCIDQKLRNHSFEIWSTTIHQQSTITEPIEFRMVSNPETHEFAIRLEEKVFVTGFARIVDNEKLDYSEYLLESSELTSELASKSSGGLFYMEQQDFYTEMAVRGYDMGEAFRLVNNVLNDGSRGFVKLTGNWIALADSIMQIFLFSESDRGLKIPTHFEWLRCDPTLLYESQNLKRRSKDESGVSVESNKTLRTIATNGLVFKFPGCTEIQRDLRPVNLQLNSQAFIPLTYILPPPKLMEQESLNVLKKCEEVLHALNQPLASRQRICQVSSIQDSLLNCLMEATKQADWKNLLKLRLFNQKCLSESLVVNPLLDLLGLNLQMFEENARYSSDVHVREMGLPVFSLEETLDRHFRRISSYSTSSTNVDLEESCNKSSAQQVPNVDLLIINHASLALLPTKDGSHRFCFSDQWEQVLTSIKPSSFVILNLRKNVSSVERSIARELSVKFDGLEHTEKLKESFERMQFIKVCELISDDENLVSIMFRKRPLLDLTKPADLVFIGSTNYDWVESIKDAIKRNDQERIWLVSNESFSGVTGLGLSLKEERNLEHKIRVILAPNWDLHENSEQFREIREKDLAINVFRDGSWGTFRYIPLDPSSEVEIYENRNVAKISRDENAKAKAIWLKSSVTEQQPCVTCYYASISHSDMTFASGREKNIWMNWSAKSIGHEFSGISSSGQRIAGICNGDGISDFIPESNIVLKFTVASNWTLRDAVGIPFAYSMAYYALMEIGHVPSGASVLLNGMSDGIGEAILNIGLRRGFQFLIVVQSDQSKKHLLNLYPQLRPDQVLTRSKRASLDELILVATKGLGMEVVINLEAEQDPNSLADWCSENGLVISLTDFSSTDLSLERTRLPTNAAFYSVSPINLIENMFLNPSRYAHVKDNLIKYIQQGLLNGQIRPLTSITYQKDELNEALDLLQVHNFTGKPIIKFREEIFTELEPQLSNSRAELTPQHHPSSMPVKCLVRSMFSPIKWYIIIGGLGGFGLQLLLWMFQRGARNFVLVSRQGIKKLYQKFILQKIKQTYSPQNIKIHHEDTFSYEASLNLVNELKKTWPIGGVFNLAGVLRSGIMENQTPESFQVVCEPKVAVTKIWDQVTRQECPKIDYFVVFSSITAHGLSGEPNYAYANSLIERIIEDRHRHGFSALAIQYGKIGDVGMALKHTCSIGGTAAQGIWSCLEALDKFLQLPYPVCCSIVLAGRKVKSDLPEAGLLQRIGHILGLHNLESLDPQVTLGDLGLDSLQAIEVQQLIEKTCGLSMPNIAIVKLTIASLNKLNEETESSAKNKEKNPELMRKFSVPILVSLSEKFTSPIFFFPPALFDFLSMLPLAKALNRTVIGVDFNEQVRRLDKMEKIADFYADKILEQYPNEKKYDFVGYSYGCLIGFEVAKVLQARLGKSRCDRITFIDASPYGLKQLGQFAMQGALDGLRLSEIFCQTMEHMGVKISSAMQKSLMEAEDDPERYRELVSQTMQDVGMNGPADAFAKNSLGMIDRGYYMTQMQDLGSFDGDALFVQVENRAARGKQSLVNEGLSQIVKGKIKTVTYDASHFAVLKKYPNEVARNIEQMMPLD